MRRALLFAFCLSLTRAAVAQEGFPLFTTDFSPEEFASRRAGVYDAIGKGAVAILQGAPTATGYTRFRQSNDFYYLSGIEVANAYLLLDGASTCPTETTGGSAARGRCSRPRTPKR
jgi:Xaa-Pro aminopeptidase